MSKTARHQAILALLEDGPVESQEVLQHSLERKGFEVGQATLSRDIHELKLVKGPEGYRRAAETAAAEGVLSRPKIDAYLASIRGVETLDDARVLAGGMLAT